MEIEHFRRILTYEEGRLTVELSGGQFTVTGQELMIRALGPHRLTLQGRFLRTDFSDK